MKCEYHPSVLDFLRRQAAEQQAEISKLRHELAVERFRRLTLEIEKAIATKDEPSWSRLVAERMGLGVSFEEAA